MKKIFALLTLAFALASVAGTTAVRPTGDFPFPTCVPCTGDGTTL